MIGARHKCIFHSNLRYERFSHCRNRVVADGADVIEMNIKASIDNLYPLQLRILPYPSPLLQFQQRDHGLPSSHVIFWQLQYSLPNSMYSPTGGVFGHVQTSKIDNSTAFRLIPLTTWQTLSGPKRPFDSEPGTPKQLPTAIDQVKALDGFDWKAKEPTKFYSFKPIYHITMGTKSILKAAKNMLNKWSSFEVGQSIRIHHHRSRLP